MYGDFSRDVSLTPRGYRRVLMQQGRVLLDADYNDQVAIILDNQDTLIKTFLARYGTAGAGFAVTVASDGQSPPTMTLAEGHYYVGGLLCARERCAEPPAFPAEVKGRRFLIYLEAWEQALAAVEDARGDFREPALDGVDTTLRTEVRCRVLLDPIKDTEFRDIPAPNADARRSEIEKIANAPAVIPPEPPKPGKPPALSTRWLVLAIFVGLLPAVGLWLDLSAERLPGWWAVAVTFALVGAAFLLGFLHSLPAFVERAQEEQRARMDGYYKALAKSYGELTASYRRLVAEAARELTEPLRRLEVTQKFQEQFEKYLADSTSPEHTTATLELRDVRAPATAPLTYRGSRSLLYRVEVHHVDDAGQVWLKWSRDNGAHLFKEVSAKPDGAQRAETASLTIAARQAASEELIDRWVELLPDDPAGDARSQLRKVIDSSWDYTTRAATLTLDRPATTPAYVRAWDHEAGASAKDSTLSSYGAIPLAAVKAGGDADIGWHTLEDGLQIRLVGSNYMTGDYWLIKVRPGEELIKVRPGEKLVSPLAAQFRQLHYAPLALVSFDASGVATATDCRILVQPAGRLDDATIDRLSPLPAALPPQQAPNP